MVSILNKKKKIKLNKVISKMLNSSGKNYCFKCGKDMTDGDGQSIIGVEFNCSILSSNKDFVRLQLGKYSKHFENGNKICFCWECWIDSFMKE
jgi:hypothetical protein